MGAAPLPETPSFFDRAKGVFTGGDANARALEAGKIYKAEFANMPPDLQKLSGGQVGLKRYYEILADQNKGISPTALLAAATIGAPLIASLFSGGDEEERASDISGFRRPNALLATRISSSSRTWPPSRLLHAIPKTSLSRAPTP